MQYGSEESQLILVPIILQLNELRVHEVKLIIVRVSVQCAGFICFSVTDDQCVQVRSEVVPCERCRRTDEEEEEGPHQRFVHVCPLNYKSQVLYVIADIFKVNCSVLHVCLPSRCLSSFQYSCDIELARPVKQQTHLKCFIKKRTADITLRFAEFLLHGLSFIW